MLYPQLNEKRLVVSLDGIWDFALGDENLDTACLTAPLKEAERLSVPASYNDQKADIRFRDHYGWAYYQRRFSVPICGLPPCAALRRGYHNAAIYLTASNCAPHWRFLPFEAEIDSALLKGSNLLSVAVDNRINYSTLPVGNEENYAMFGSGAPDYESVRKTNIKPQNYPNFDFFNYCGINRPVKLYTTRGSISRTLRLQPKSLKVKQPCGFRRCFPARVRRRSQSLMRRGTRLPAAPRGGYSG
jgi:beta-glucuronidase